MKKNRKRSLIVISVFSLVVLLGSITYAFFNYTRTGQANTISVGRISFVTRQTETISLTNVFPISSSDIDTDTDNVGEVVIEITGDTNYVGGIEYLVSTTNANVYSGGKIVPISIDVIIDDLGTSNDYYFTVRNSKNATIYKRLSGNSVVGNQDLLVGYIKPNTTSGTIEGIDGRITIKAYFDKDKIAISDTYDGQESDLMGTTSNWVDERVVLTATEWNTIQTNGLSFKVKVEANEGIWVDEPFYNMMKMNAVMDNIASINVASSTGIDFNKISGDTDNDGIKDNGDGLYIRAGTENDAYPIIYYRGAVENNNVFFADKCWKMVRTTDTGGIKLIYNGLRNTILTYDVHTEMDENDINNISNDATYPFSYDTSTGRWKSSNQGNQTTSTLQFKVKESGDYDIAYTSSSGTMVGRALFYKSGNMVKKVRGNNEGIVNLGNVTTDDTIKVEYTRGYSSNGDITKDYIIFWLIKNSGNYTTQLTCDNHYGNSVISVNIDNENQNLFRFNDNNDSFSLANAGYMHTLSYISNRAEAVTGAYFGNSFTYDETNHVYSLVDPKIGIDEFHHYTCNLTSANGTCSSIRYYIMYDGFYKYYFPLTGGKGVENIFDEVQVNSTSSTAKNGVDMWYEQNINNTEYTVKIEDAVYCNDRGIYELGGMNPNGGSYLISAYFKPMSTYLFYSAHKRTYIDHVPSLKCYRTNDAFTVSNLSGNGSLNYPIGLITSDEIMLAGGRYGSSNDSFYLNSGINYWTMTPAFYYNSRGPSRNYNVGEYGDISDAGSYVEFGIRPMISLKSGTSLINGDGSTINPYIVK